MDYNGHKMTTFLILNVIKTTTTYSLQYGMSTVKRGNCFCVYIQLSKYERLFDKIFHFVFTVLQYLPLMTFLKVF